MNEERVIALGFFDGVHLGHGALLRRARQLAEERGCTDAAVTFDVHPDLLVRGTPVPLLNTAQDRRRLMQTLYGTKEMLTLHFDRAMMEQPWEEFVTQCLMERYHACHVVCGHDFRFGRGGGGTPERLRGFCGARGLGCDVIGAVKLDGITVSSTGIRQLLAEGQTERANRFLGHPHCLTGTVIAGRHLGHTLGIPTANLAVPPGILVPRHGVYASRVFLDGTAHPAVTNVGTRPTVGGTHVTVEPWLLDFDGDLYGRELRVEFLRYLRGERKFSSLDEMKAEILRNADQTADFLENL